MLDLQSYQDLYMRSLTAKVQLSSRPSTTLVQSYEGKSLKVEVTREEFEKRSEPLRERCRMICEIVMEEARLRSSNIDRIILTGGMTRMPSVRKMIDELAAGVVDRWKTTNPDETVAMGAAIQASLLLLQEENVTGTRKLPATVRRKFSTDEGDLLRVTNITTHTLGVVLWDENIHEEYVFPMIPRMTAVPAEAKSSFGLARANMKSLTVRVVEGNSTVPAECTPLGRCEVLLPEGMAKGAPIGLTYSYNESQILEIDVEAGGRHSRVSISRNTGLSESEIERARNALLDIVVA